MKKLVVLAALTIVLSNFVYSQSDAALRLVIEKDRSSRDARGKLVTLTAAEHLSRGKVYFDNRHFPESREHFQKIIDNFGTDAAMSGALFMTGRSYYWERSYDKAIPWLDRVAREFPATKDGREGLSFKGACHVRLGKHLDAAKIYEQYTVMYPTGERIDGAYLNTIDALREGGKYDDASAWVDKARARFAGTSTEASALHARLRMEMYRGKWQEAEATAALMQAQAKFAGSMTSADEVRFLRGFALEKQGRRNEAMAMYGSFPEGSSSYFSGLALDRVNGGRVTKTASVTAKDFPAPYRTELLRHARPRKIDPRFLLAVMKQESSFRADAKSPSAARGLLQLVYDTALKYNRQAGFPTIQPDDLYKPSVNIAIGCEYVAALKKQFGGLDEAVAASYNGGEDNAARWLNRSKPREAGIFTAEIGFAETKDYVQKVMRNYRIYRSLYDETLNRK
ncbi:MAG: transglycosylase SLT domain-containing protein [Pyrinomonadaceae bacterium]